MSDWAKCLPEHIEDIVDRITRLTDAEADKLFRYFVRYVLQTSKRGSQIVAEELLREIKRS